MFSMAKLSVSKKFTSKRKIKNNHRYRANYNEFRDKNKLAVLTSFILIEF